MIQKLRELQAQASEEGFTLIELMITVVIIGILAAIAIPIFTGQQKAAIDAGVKSDVKNMADVTIPTKLAANGNNLAAQVAPLVGSVDGQTLTAQQAKYQDISLSDENTKITIGGGWSDFTVLATNESSESVWCSSIKDGARRLHSGEDCKGIPGYTEWTDELGNPGEGGGSLAEGCEAFGGLQPEEVALQHGWYGSYEADYYVDMIDEGWLRTPQQKADCRARYSAAEAADIGAKERAAAREVVLQMVKDNIAANNRTDRTEWSGSTTYLNIEGSYNYNYGAVDVDGADFSAEASVTSKDPRIGIQENFTCYGSSIATATCF